MVENLLISGHSFLNVSILCTGDEKIMLKDEWNEAFIQIHKYYQLFRAYEFDTGSLRPFRIAKEDALQKAI